MSSVSHIFYVSDALDQSQRVQLQYVFNQLNSVHSANFDRRRKHLLAVAYDPDQLSSKDLLGIFLQNGVRANTLHY